MHQQGQILGLAAFSGAVLLGAGAADCDWVHCLEVTGIRRQVDVNLFFPLLVMYSPVAPM